MKISLWLLIKKDWKDQYLLVMLVFKLRKLKSLKFLKSMEK